ncbi:MAG: 30S ribosomal protein S6 [Dehalococcoidia bacterium]|nr:MAG: 30S ribosomal protein S6 [Dehalococcoidia bacterium]
MRDYEMVMIISPDVAEEDVPGTIDKVSDFITSKGGEVTQIDRWGKKKMAYPINRFSEGNYVVSRFKIEPGMTTELEASLKITEQILRHMLVRLGE